MDVRRRFNDINTFSRKMVHRLDRDRTLSISPNNDGIWLLFVLFSFFFFFSKNKADRKRKKKKNIIRHNSSICIYIYIYKHYHSHIPMMESFFVDAFFFSFSLRFSSKTLAITGK